MEISTGLSHLSRQLRAGQLGGVSGPLPGREPHWTELGGPGLAVRDSTAFRGTGFSTQDCSAGSW